MLIDTNESQVRTIEQVRQAPSGTSALEFRGCADDQGCYDWIDSVRRRFDFERLKRPEHGLHVTFRQLGGCAV